MRRILLTLGLVALTTPATAQNLFEPGIYEMARGLNCQSWDLKSTSEQAPMLAPIPEWIVFNEGPSPVVVRGYKSRSRNIEVFSGKVTKVIGEQGSTYTIGLGAAGSARIYVCRA